MDTHYKIRLKDGFTAIVTPVKLRNVFNEREIVVDAVWDTGATFSAVTKRVVDELDLFEMAKGVTSGINGDVIGLTRIALTFPGNMKYATWAEMNELRELPGPFDVLLGLDVISKGNMHLTHDKDGYWFEFVFDTSKFINLEDDSPEVVIKKLMAGLEEFRPKNTKRCNQCTL